MFNIFSWWDWRKRKIIKSRLLLFPPTIPASASSFTAESYRGLPVTHNLVHMMTWGEHTHPYKKTHIPVPTECILMQPHRLKRGLACTCTERFMYLHIHIWNWRLAQKWRHTPTIDPPTETHFYTQMHPSAQTHTQTHTVYTHSHM